MKMKYRLWHLFHSWGDYEHFHKEEYIGNDYLVTLTCKDLLRYIPTIQIRKCTICGKTERHDFRNNQELKA